MSDLLQSGASWLSGVLRQHASQTVVIARSSRTTEGVAASVGRSEFEDVDAESVVVRVETRDFLIAAADYQIAGVTVIPQRGDQIRQTDAAGVVHTYVVSAPAPNPVWRWSDPYHRTLRIHTVEES